jgi:cytochrome c553
MKFLATTILAVTLALAGCGENAVFAAKRTDSTKQQIADIEDRIKAFGVVHVSAEPVNFSGSTSAYVVSDSVQLASADVMPGQGKYAACGACHGVRGQGGVGPMLAGQTVEYIVSRLRSYKAGETVGPQSALMWGQASMLSEDDIKDLAEYINTMGADA